MLPRRVRARIAARRTIAATLVAVMALASASAAGGRLVALELRSSILEGAVRPIQVYLPASYDSAANAERRYPTVYLLHGWPGGETDWPHKGHAAAILDSLIAEGRIPEVLAVMPSGRGRGLLGRSMYVNSWNDSSRIEDYLAVDVVAWADSALRTRPEARYRAIVGLSDGGSGAMNIGFHHPEVFGACGSLSGEFRLSRGLGEHRLLGPDSSARTVLEHNSPLDYVGDIAPRLAESVVYFDCGASDGAVAQNREFHQRLDSLGIAHVYHEFPGKHRWSYWREHLPDALEVLTSRMR
jgi:S-formylglutathione hydrolase FrmB